MTNSSPELEKVKLAFVIGSNTTEQHPILGAKLMKAKAAGAQIILADPRAIQLSIHADIHLRHKPGTDSALVNGMMSVILNEDLHDKQFIADHTEGFDVFRELIAQWSPARASEITGVAVEEIEKAARMFAAAEVASVVYCMGITQHVCGTDNVLDLANLQMLCGNMGKEGGGVNPLRGQNNVQGACDVGGLPNVYTAYQKVVDPAVVEKFEKGWGVSGLPNTNGLTVVELLNGVLEGRIKAMYILGENPMLSDPDSHHVEQALKALDLLVIQDIFMTETARLAHYVLPGAAFAEKDGTFTATDRRVQRVRKAIDPPGEARQDWWIIGEVGRRIDPDIKMTYDSAEEIFEELRTLTPSYAGVTFKRLDEPGGLQWPCPTEDHPGTPFLHKDGKFPRGKGLFAAIDFIPAAELPDDEYPFILTTGRIMFHYHTGSMTRRSDKLHKEVPEGFVEIHPADARTLGVKSGDRLDITTRRGTITVPAKVDRRVSKGVIFIPFHFAEAAANILTNPALDPKSKIPEYKVCAAKVEVAAADQKAAS